MHRAAPELAVRLSGRQTTLRAGERGACPVLEQDYRDAAELMDASGMGGHTIDALVAAVARRQPRPVLVATSDPVDLPRLLQRDPGVGVLPV